MKIIHSHRNWNTLAGESLKEVQLKKIKNTEQKLLFNCFWVADALWKTPDKCNIITNSLNLL